MDEEDPENGLTSPEEIKMIIVEDQKTAQEIQEDTDKRCNLHQV